jgi:hypothetical protein
MARLRTKRWARPSAITHWPQVIEQGIHKVRQQCEHRCGGLYELLNSSKVLGPESRSRTRRMRSDGLINLESFLLSLLTSTDLASGAVADPAQADGTCMRQLDVRAYGERVAGERSMRRAERHARTLTHLGLLETIEQRHKLPKRYRSTPAVRSFDLDRLFGLLGLRAVYRIARKNILSEPQRQLIARLSTARRSRDRRRHFAAQARASAAAAPAHVPTPPPPDPPPRTDSAAALAAQAEIRSLFDD